PLLSQGSRGRCGQRHPHRNRPQSSPRPRLAQTSFAPDLARPVPSTRPRAGIQIGFLTDDELYSPSVCRCFPITWPDIVWRTCFSTLYLTTLTRPQVTLFGQACRY